MKNSNEKFEKQKVNWNIKPYLAVGLTAFIVIILSIAVFFVIFRYTGLTAFGKRLMGILQPIIIGVVLAYLVSPIVTVLEKLIIPILDKHMASKGRVKRLSRAISVTSSLTFVFLIIGILLNMVIPELYRSIENLISTLPRQVESFIEWFNTYTKTDNEITRYVEMGLLRAAEYFENWARTDILPQTKNIVTMLTTGIINVVRLLVNFIIGIIISVYLLTSREVFIGQSKKIVYALLSPKHGNVLIKTIRKSNEIFGGFISGKILDSFIIGIICFIGLYLLNMPYVVLVSVVVGVTNVVPFFGPYIGAIPCSILITIVNPIQGLYFVIFIIILQQVDGNIIGPAILGESTGLSSFWVVFAILVAGGLFGFVGMVMGVPVFGVIYYLIKEVIEYILVRRSLPVETENYTKLSIIDRNTNELKYEEAELNRKKIEDDKKAP